MQEGWRLLGRPVAVGFGCAGLAWAVRLLMFSVDFDSPRT